MGLITWLLNRFRQYRELKEQVTRLNDRLWEKERKIDDLLTQLEDLRFKLQSMQDELNKKSEEFANYVAAIAKLPPLSNPHSWLAEQQRVQLEREKLQSMNAIGKQTLLDQAQSRVEAYNQHIQHTLEQIPAVVEGDIKAFNEQRQAYVQGMQDYFQNLTKEG